MKKIALIIFLIKALANPSQADTYLFKAEKNGISIDFFGTLHSLPLNELPIPVVDYIKDHEVFITENKQALEPLAKDLAKKMGVLRESEEENYYSSLDTLYRDKLFQYAGAFLKYKNAPIDIEELNIKGLAQAYLMGHMVKGMDYSLLSYFKEQGKIILGLEDLQEVSTHFESISLESFKEGLQVDFGFGSEEDHEHTQAYLKGDILANPLYDEEIKLRNLNWLQCIIDYHERYGEKAIISVGYAHLLGEFGVLNMLEKEGFKISRADEAVNFSPISLASLIEQF